MTRRNASERVILFVENDEDHLYEILCEIQALEPYWSFELVHDMKTAVEWLTRYSADLIVVDVMLPSVHNVQRGLEGVYLVAAIRGTLSLPTIFSGAILPRNREAALVHLTGRGAMSLKGDLAKLAVSGFTPAEARALSGGLGQQAATGVLIIEKGGGESSAFTFVTEVLRPLLARLE